MKLAHPTPRQNGVIVQAMYAVVSAGGTVEPLPFEIECIEAIERHIFGQTEPLSGKAGPLPTTLASELDNDTLRHLALRMLCLLTLVDRKIMPSKVAVVRQAATALGGIEEYGIVLLENAAKGNFKRIAIGMMNRFVGRFHSPTGKARLQDWLSFAWWMMPGLHGPNTTKRNRAMVDRYKALGDQAPDTFGYALHDFFIRNEIPLPGQATGIPWSMHETYHILGDYDVGLPEELLLTAFMGGTQEETCLDQLCFGLIVYHCGKPIIGGFVTEAILLPDDYFRALAHGARSNIDFLAGWNMWDVAPLTVSEVRARYNLTPDDRARKVLDLPADRPLPPNAVSMPTPLATPWRDPKVKKALIADPRTNLRQFGIAIPEDVTLKVIGSRGHPADGIDTLLQFVVERGQHSSSFFMPSPLHPTGQQAAYGCFLNRSENDPILEHLVLADSAAALQQVRAA